ncbi:hypothetical protein QNI16_12515 [Cytophagaceae bacterium YF14B1]|uniref:Uncharacterized protein n=1 Tax=Xanthocytophaga flava TaxID=3048013 RepID=A0AAE3QL16_9BACT|nr:hypothetical protein [Xanthocytophaga flavus]MDJ1481312.1 hypothetical protein [Xanthocytophaga flavus]
MRLKSIKSDTPLAKLFNAFMNSLSIIDITHDPIYYSMKVHNASIDREKVDTESIYDAYTRFERHYQLAILSNGLRQFHSATLEVEKHLIKYFDEYTADWKAYATQERMLSIEEFGGDDKDYNEDGSIRYKEDWESIKSYTLHSNLSSYIGGNYHEEGKNCEVRGEGLGTSRAQDYADFLLMVRNESDFSPFKFLAKQGIDLQPYRQNESGDMEPMTLADTVEAEMNTDIRNESIADLFSEAIETGFQVRELFESLSLDQDHKEEYSQMLQFVQQIKTVTFGFLH